MTAKLHQRILAKARVNRETGCWEWTGAANSLGYGVVWIGGSNKYVHRLFCQNRHGPAPAGCETRHACHNRRCFNPRHLSWGTPKENYADKRERGTDQVGERSGAAKLTLAAVKKIRSSDRPAKDLASQYGVTATNIRYIRQMKTWRTA